MRRRQLALGTALVVLLMMPATGLGWFSLFSRPSHRTATGGIYYCPVPIAAPVPYAIPVTPVPGPTLAPPQGFAEPRPAPPSGTPEPPRAPDTMPRAGVNTQESRKIEEKIFDSYFVAGTTRTPGGDRCTVTFWNLSGQHLTLTVERQPRPLPSGQNVRLDLKREFSWSVAGRDAVHQQVPAAESGVEIVIRRP